MEFICPQLLIWHEIHQKLQNFWKIELHKVGNPPPKPLILAGWNYSGDYEKAMRWKQKETWALDRNCSHLIPPFSENQIYWV